MDRTKGYDIDDYISYYHGMEKLPKATNERRHNENGILILVCYYFLKDSLGEFGEAERLIANEIIRNLRTHKVSGGRYNGLYDRGADESKIIPKHKRRTISHDNLTAISAFSSAFDLPYARYIYNHGVNHQWRFDNVEVEKPRWSRLMHPRDIIYWSRVGGTPMGKKIAWLFMWFFYLTQIVACFSKYKRRKDSKIISTSGQQMMFVRMYALSKMTWVGKVMFKLCKKITEWRFGCDFADIFKMYYGGIEGQIYPDHNPDHPIIHVSRKAHEQGVL